MSSGGINTSVIHGVLRPAPLVGQTYANPAPTAPVLIGQHGGLIVEGISTNVSLGAVTVTDTVVGAASVSIMAANINRISNTFQNNGLQTVYLGFDAPAVAGAGVTLYPQTTWESELVFQGQVFAITAAGTSRVTVLKT